LDEDVESNSRAYIKSFEILNVKVKDSMSKTLDNLKAAFAGESQANRRYLAFAQRAEEEGRPQVAKLFRAAAEAETVHALNHMRVIGEVKTTPENLNTAVSGETFEFKQMYPEYFKVAKEEKNSQAAWSFNVANQVEQVHAKLFTEAINALKAGKEPPEAEYYVCSVCGNTVKNEPPEKCPICGNPKSKFFKAA
jgi:rubrerythrin